NAAQELIRNAKAAAVLVGKSGRGPWETKGTAELLQEFRRRPDAMVISCMLPECPTMRPHPSFLEGSPSLDLRYSTHDPGVELAVKMSTERFLKLVGWPREPLLVQTFQGEFTEVTDESVTIQFDMGSRKELRRFDRAQLMATELRVGEAIELRCEIVL